MKQSNIKTQTFREKLYAGVEPHEQSKVDALLNASIRGSDRIEGIRRSRNSYAVENPRDLPRVPREHAKRLFTNSPQHAAAVELTVRRLFV
ncbi:MAG: hypothetical protein ACLFVJ_12240 [Persicimonas sp.]